MPRYRYQCHTCEHVATIFHSFDDEISDCGECGTEGSLKKILTTPLKHVIIKETSKNSRVGDVTKEHIETNRKILDEEKKKARNKTYEPS